MITEKIIFEETNGVARLTLNRPDQGNAVDLEMMRAIEESLATLNQQRRSRVLVIRGEGEDFCARLDLGKQDGGVKKLRLIPRKKAFELLIMGKEINAYQAEQFGVINLVVKAGSLQAEGQAWVSQLLAIEGAALGACKEFFRSTAHLSIEDTARHGVAFLVNFLAAKKS